MSESRVPVKIQHDGEYCGECQFSRYSVSHGYLCQIYTGATLQRRGNQVKRSEECIERAVPVKEKPAAVLIGGQELDPAEAESIAEYAKFKFPERFKNG